MTPKEKAQELVSRFLSINLSQVSELVDGIRIRLAKESALIAVDEIINIAYWEYMESGGGQEEKYWIQVKQEVENL